jgi:sterol desaturase/sphingolipid hydroxylase (fatty acid hydroxylase superfamily)
MASFILYGTLAVPLLILQHSNYKLPGWMEKYARIVFATPGWHKIHHSDHQPLTDSHYGDVFTFWDRLFGTWQPVQPEEIRFGLKDFEGDERQKALYLLKSPFIRD